jgi:cell division protein ZapA (FtsZ GTPase activity inhibitor)
LLVEREKKMILAGLNSMDELDELEAREQKKREEKTRREAQLPVSISEVSVPADTP